MPAAAAAAAHRTAPPTMPHPYEEHEDTPLWAAVAAAVGDLEENGDLQLTTAPQYVVGYLCRQLVAAGLIAAPSSVAGTLTAEQFAAFLERAADAGPGSPDWQAHVATHYADARLEESRRQAALLGLRIEQGGITAEQAATYFRALARGLREHGS